MDYANCNKQTSVIGILEVAIAALDTQLCYDTFLNENILALD